MLIERERKRRRLLWHLMTGVSPGRTLVSPGVISPSLTLTRSHTPTTASASAIGGDGATINTFAQNVARFAGVNQRLLIEGARTNSIRNPRAEGAAPGAPGTLPTNWLLSVLATGLTTEVLGTGTEFGVPFLDLRLSGTPGGDPRAFVAFEPTTGVAALSGQTWTGSVYVRRSGGTWAGVTGEVVAVDEYTSGGGFLVTSSSAVTSNTSAPTRGAHTRTLNNASTAFTLTSYGVTMTVGVATDVRFRLCAPQLEQAPFASSSVLPVAATPAATTRSQDVVSGALSGLGVPASGACTVLWRGVLPQAAPAGASQNLVEIHDGTVNNRFFLLNPAGTSTLRVQRALAGAAAFADAGTLTAGTEFRAGLVVRGDGTAAASLNGGAAVSVTGGPTTGLTTLRLGDNAGGTAPLFGEVARCVVLPFAASDADLQNRVATF